MNPSVREDALRELRRQAPPIGRVLGVHDAEAGAELLAQALQPLLDRSAPRRAEHVRDEKNPQGSSESVAAGRTSTETWLPESEV